MRSPPPPRPRHARTRRAACNRRAYDADAAAPNGAPCETGRGAKQVSVQSSLDYWQVPNAKRRASMIRVLLRYIPLGIGMPSRQTRALAEFVRFAQAKQRLNLRLSSFWPRSGPNCHRKLQTPDKHSTIHSPLDASVRARSAVCTSSCTVPRTVQKTTRPTPPSHPPSLC